MSHTINARQSKRGSHGFTLIEVMITVIIVAVLLAIAVPSYQQSLMKSRRADGMAALLDMAARQERFYAQNSTYTTNITAATGLNRPATSTEGHYTLAVTAVTVACPIIRCYALTATPTGEQAKDELCNVLRLNSVGVRSASGSLGAQCW